MHRSFFRPAILLTLFAAAGTFPADGQVVIPLTPPPFQRPARTRRRPAQPVTVPTPGQNGYGDTTQTAPTGTGNRRRRRPTGPVLPPPVAGDAEDFINSAPVLSASGLLYLASWNHQLQALDAKTGAVRWKFKTGDILNASPALGPDGLIYLSSRDKNVYALDAVTGVKKWQFTTGGPLNTRPAVGSNGLVYVAAFDKKVIALDAKTGAKRWERKTQSIPSSPALSQDNTVYVSASNLYALNGETGAVKWSLDLGVLQSEGPAVGENGTVYVGTPDALLLALDGASGKTLWQFDTGHSMDYPIVFGPDGILYASAQKLFAIRASNGKERWERSGGGSAWSAPVIGDNSVVYVGYNDLQMYALNAATGRTKWQFDTGDGLLCFPTLGPDGTVYFQCEGDSKIYALSRGTGRPRWIADQDPLPSSAQPVVADVPARR